jgi:hypothetical protein
MPGKLIVVKAAFDPEARVWFVEDSGDLHGLNVEAPSLETLVEKLPAAVADLLELADLDGDREAPIEVIAHARTRVRLGAGA